MASYKPVEAILRGLEVLATVGRLGACRAAEIQAATGISGPTVIRILETLMDAGYVRQDAPRGRYLLTARVTSLAAGYNASADLFLRAGPRLAELQALISWPSDVAVRSGAEMITVATTPASGRLSFNQPAGYRTSMLHSSLGLAFLAHASEGERAGIISSLFPQGAAVAEAAKLQRKLEAVRRLGYATMDRGLADAARNDSLQTLGVPILSNGTATAALNVIFLRKAVSLRTAIKEFLPALEHTADALGRDGRT